MKYTDTETERETEEETEIYRMKRDDGKRERLSD